MGKGKSSKPKGNGRPAADKKPPGCYVLSLSVENVRCFGPKQTLDCSDGNGRPRQWTVILGDNGTGKTTLLQVLASHECEAEDYRGVEFRTPKLIHHEPRFLRRHLHEGIGDSELRVVHQSTFASPEGKQQIGKWVSRSPVSARYETMLRDFAVFGYGPIRASTTTEASVNAAARSPSDAAASLFNSAVRLPDAESWLLNLDYSRKSPGDGKQRELFLQILSLLIGVLPEVREIRFEPGIGVVPRPCVEFLTPYGWVPLRQLGHGYQTMTAWVVDFVSRMVERYPDSENPLAEPAVCLVDEIDLHLHPVWQRKVIGYLSERFPNTQFIVTAHSPLVVQAAASADANIAVLVRSEKPDADGNHYVEIRNNPEDVRNWRLDQILTSDLFGGLSLNPPKVEDLFKEKEHLVGLKRLKPEQKARLAEIEAELAKLPVGDDAREVKEMQAIRDALNHLQKHTAK